MGATEEALITLSSILPHASSSPEDISSDNLSMMSHVNIQTGPAENVDVNLETSTVCIRIRTRGYRRAECITLTYHHNSAITTYSRYSFLNSLKKFRKFQQSQLRLYY
jgi:hypothetical protein